QIRVGRRRRYATALDQRLGVGTTQGRPLRLALAPQFPARPGSVHQPERVVLERVRLGGVRSRLSFLIILPRLPGDAVGEDRADHLAVDDELHQIGWNGDIVDLWVLDQVDPSEHRDAQWLWIRRMVL